MQQMKEMEGDLGQFSLSQQENRSKGALLENATDIKVCSCALLGLGGTVFPPPAEEQREGGFVRKCCS